MTQRHNGGDRDGQGNGGEQLKMLLDDDAFLTDLSRGVDPSRGSDPLAGLLLELGREASAPMPAAPDLATLLPELGGPDSGTTEFAGAPGGVGAADSAEQREDATVVPLRSRKRSRHRAGASGGSRVSPFVHGLLGAAAATLVIAGGGTAVYNAGPDSPLYGVNRQIFGGTEGPSVVELASTLEEVDSRTANGDVEGARELLEQARAMLNDMNQRQNQQPRTPAPKPTTETVTATTTEESSPEQVTPTPETVTETHTEVQTVTSTVVVQPPVQSPQPVPSPPTEPTPDPGVGAGSPAGDATPSEDPGN